MTLEDALQELGIDGSATPDEARRAYLRGIKTRKPETDPEGFRRLREAYEIVTGALAQPQMEPGSEEPDEEEEAPPELVTLAARLRDLPAETHLEERLAALREAVRDHPRSTGVRWWLIEELGRVGRQDEVLEAIRQGEADGLPGFLELRAADFPDSIGPEDLARLEISASPEVLAIAARIYMKGSRYDEAAAALGRALDRLAEMERPAAAQAQPIPRWLPRGILALEEAGRTAEARALHDRLWSWLSSTGDVTLIKRWGTDFVWRLAHELAQLDPAFPLELRRAAAAAALEHKGEPPAEEAKRLRKNDAERAEQAAAMLYDLPILYHLYFRVLQGVGPGQRPRVVQGRGQSYVSKFITAAIWLVCLYGLLQKHCPSSPQVPLAAQAWQAWDLLGGTCDPARPKLPPKACDAAGRAVLKARDGDCRGAHAALDDMTTQMKGFSAPDLSKPRAFQTRMLSALDANCGFYQLWTGGRSSP